MTQRGVRIHRGLGIAAIVVAAAVALPVPFAAPPANAQGTGALCETFVNFQNRQRRVHGPVNVECGNECFVWPFCHTKPYGNWGVDSFYGDPRNGYQFPGWKRVSRSRWLLDFTKLLQWHSCTSDKKEPYHGTQVANPDGVASYAGLRYQGTVGDACNRYATTFTYNRNYMTLYELDSPGRHDWVANVNYPNISFRVRCSDDWDCEGSSSWRSPTSGARVASAQIRIVVSRSQSTCDFNDEGSICF